MNSIFTKQIKVLNKQTGYTEIMSVDDAIAYELENNKAVEYGKRLHGCRARGQKQLSGSYPASLLTPYGADSIKIVEEYLGMCGKFKRITSKSTNGFTQKDWVPSKPQILPSYLDKPEYRAAALRQMLRNTVVGVNDNHKKSAALHEYCGMSNLNCGLKDRPEEYPDFN